MPRWCKGSHSRRVFFDGKNSDVGSVRRYRMALDDDETEGEDKLRSVVDEKSSDRKTGMRRGRIWNCLSLMR